MRQNILFFRNNSMKFVENRLIIYGYLMGNQELANVKQTSANSHKFTSISVHVILLWWVIIPHIQHHCHFQQWFYISASLCIWRTKMCACIWHGLCDKSSYFRWKDIFRIKSFFFLFFHQCDGGFEFAQNKINLAWTWTCYKWRQNAI